MRILIDEDMPSKVRHLLNQAGHECYSMQFMKDRFPETWGKEVSENRQDAWALGLAKEHGFHIAVSGDTSIFAELKDKTIETPIVVLHDPKPRSKQTWPELEPLVPRLKEVLGEYQATIEGREHKTLGVSMVVPKGESELNPERNQPTAERGQPPNSKRTLLVDQGVPQGPFKDGFKGYEVVTREQLGISEKASAKDTVELAARQGVTMIVSKDPEIENAAERSGNKVATLTLAGPNAGREDVLRAAMKDLQKEMEERKIQGRSM